MALEDTGSAVATCNDTARHSAVLGGGAEWGSWGRYVAGVHKPAGGVVWAVQEECLTCCNSKGRTVRTGRRDDTQSASRTEY